MKLISSRVHGYLDYIVGALLVATPWLFGFARGGAETWVFIAQGTLAILYSLLTNYELGVVRILSMRVHLVLDLAASLFLAFSPWIFGFSDYIWVPHIIFGIMEILVVALSVSTSGTEVKQKKLSGLRPGQ
ncbi:SPW repeat domain-containing protein [Flavitalea antarctica]